MKLFFLGLLALVGILIRVMTLLPWENRRSGNEGPVRFNFLLGLMVVVVLATFLFLWFGLKTK